MLWFTLLQYEMGPNSNVSASHGCEGPETCKSIGRLPVSMDASRSNAKA